MTEISLPGLKRLFFDRIFQRSYWTWRKHPVIIIPTMLGTAITVIEQSIITTAVILLLTSFASRGLLPRFLASLRQPLSLFSDPSFTPTLIPLLVISISAFVLVSILGGGFVASSEYGVYLEAWRNDKASFRSVLEHGSRGWRSMAWTLFLSNLIAWGPAVVAYLFVLFSLFSAGVTGGTLGVVVSSLIFDVALLVSLVISIFTVYSFPAVVVDRVSGFAAIRRSFTTAGRNLGVTMTYSVVRGIFQTISTLIVLTAGVIGLPLSSLATAILSFLLTPILHSTKTMIYTYAGPSESEMPFELANPIWQDIGRRLPRAALARVRTGLSEISKFLTSPRNLPFHLASISAFTAGGFLGNYVSSNGLKDFFLRLGYQPGRVNPILQQVVPPVFGFDIFLHNWLVSIATALSGIGFGIPSFETILFNGFILGVIAPLSPSLTMLLAAILPHGIIEIPAFVLSGSIGIRLGYAAIRTRLQPGEVSTEYLASTLRQAVYVVVGLVPLFLIAGLIEGDITPIIMRMFGWTF